jgi:hypothetical protein
LKGPASVGVRNSASLQIGEICSSIVKNMFEATVDSSAVYTFGIFKLLASDIIIHKKYLL